jgi:hypothetical protein
MPASPPPDSFALVLIDVTPLRHAAWAEFHAARKAAEKSARDLHRHEETDTLAYERWLHGTFPQLVTRLRELHAEAMRKARDVHHAQFMADLTGRSVKKVWKENRADEAGPETGEDDNAPEPESSHHSDYTRADDDEDFAAPPAAPTPDNPDARDIYRRLVQHLHPDRGGEWTPAREHLWHQVQQAWVARDADWLARLEIEWDTANDQIGPDSSLSRLRRAIEELHAARRDAERKLRAYRRSPAWRFTLSEKKRPHLHRRLKSELHEDLAALQRHLAYLNATIAAWESPPPGRRKDRR